MSTFMKEAMTKIAEWNGLNLFMKLERKKTPFEKIVNTLRLYFRKVDKQLKVESLSFEIAKLEQQVAKGEITEMSFSMGNSKMGSILNVNFPVGISCRKDAPCLKGCYAKKGNFCFTQQIMKYWANFFVWKYWTEQAREKIISLLAGARFFRCFASGDAPDYEFVDTVMEAGIKNPHCDIWLPTKKYELVNEWMDRHNTPEWKAMFPKIHPNNVHVMFSRWKGWEPENPYGFSVSEVDFHDGTIHVGFRCPGHCNNCHHCFLMEDGETIIYDAH